MKVKHNSKAYALFTIPLVGGRTLLDAVLKMYDEIQCEGP
jgi:hypothetical protein